MLDEHVKKTIEYEREKFHKEIYGIISDFKKNFNPLAEIKELKDLLIAFKKSFEMTCELNELKKPKIENNLKKSIKKKENDEQESV